MVGKLKQRKLKQRKLKQRSLVLLAIGLLCATNSLALEQEIAWIQDIQAAMKRARTESKPIMVDVWAIWCVPCAELDKTTYRTASLVESSKQFVPLKVDQDAQTAFSEYHSVDAWPTILFLDERGQEIIRHRGFIAAEPLEKLMTTISGGYSTYRKALAKGAASSELLAAAEFLERCGNRDRAASLRRKAERSQPSR